MKSPSEVVSVLCAARNSIYHDLEGVEVYDIDRDARTFQGDTPVICHPPCRSWSAYTSHQAKPAAGERELALWCCEQLRICGGVLEQPAHSRLFAAAGLPLPGEGSREGLYSVAVNQNWWDYPIKKRTWLCISQISPFEIYLPYRLHAQGAGRRRWQVMSKNQRSATTPAFANFLVELARKACQNRVS